MMGNAESKTNLPSFTQLRAFREVARVSNISRAALELRRSQSAVTQSILSLEQAVGAALFNRTRTGCYLTEAGKILRPRIESCLSWIQAGILELLLEGSGDPATAEQVGRRITKSHFLALLAMQRHGTFSGAAANEGLALASLYRSVRGLEATVGRALFDQSIGRIAVNQPGERLAAKFRLALREWEWAEEELKSQDGEIAGRIVVGAAMLAGSNFVAIEMGHFASRYPNVHVTIVSGTYDVLLSRLRGGHIDFLIGRLKTPAPVDDVVEEMLGSDQYIIAASADHPLTRSKRLTSSHLGRFDWVVPAARHAIFYSIFDERHAPKISLQTHSLTAIFIMLAASQRVAIVTRSELDLESKLGNRLVALNFPVNRPPSPIGFTVRVQWRPTALQNTFMLFLRSETMQRMRAWVGDHADGAGIVQPT